jgi:hypothetical protein
MRLNLPDPSPAAPSAEASRPPAVRSSACVAYDEVEDGVDALGIPLADRGPQIRAAVEDLARSELAQVCLVLGERRHDHVRTCVRRELDEEAADASRSADHEYLLAGARRECVDRRQGGDPRDRRRSRRGQVSVRRLRGHHVVGNPDQLRQLPSWTVGFVSGTKPKTSSPG